LAKEGHIVVFGIVPDKPETGYGYIRLSQPFDKPASKAQWMAQGMPVQAFVEKPARHLAEQYLVTGDHLWNAGIFAMTLRTLYSELGTYFPASEPYLAMDYNTLMRHFAEIPKTSFDFAVMEKTQRAVVIPMHIDWSDVGSWDSVYEMLPKDEAENGVQGHVRASDTTGSLLVNRTTEPMVITGLENMIVVKTDDGLLITARGESQHIGTLTASLLAKASSSALPV
jgi:mannose-1-phosphate guanylyltransferase/mannose-6-phosphate isomerase